MKWTNGVESDVYYITTQYTNYEIYAHPFLHEILKIKDIHNTVV
jgi:hypothetical protein